MATKRARPTLASQAESARSSKGQAEKVKLKSCRDQRERARNRESMMPSRHRRTDSKWVRWKASPASIKKKEAERVKDVGVIRYLRTLTTSF